MNFRVGEFDAAAAGVATAAAATGTVQAAPETTARRRGPLPGGVAAPASGAAGVLRVLGVLGLLGLFCIRILELS
ncbi:hypothetical protein C5C22_15880, partial [Rathayibacter rathayi]